MTVRDLAQTAYDALVRGDRTSETTYKQIILRGDTAPDWMFKLCQTAGAGMGSDLDWTYEFIQDSLSELSETDPADWDDVRMDADEYYPYTRDQLNWLAGSINTLGLCDEAMAEYGCEYTDIGTTITIGMTHAMNQTLDAVRTFLTDMAGENTEDSEGEDE